MIFQNEKQKKINDLYKQLYDLKLGKKVLKNAIDNNFYNRVNRDKLFIKMDRMNFKIKMVKKQIAKEKREYEKSKLK